MYFNDRTTLKKTRGRFFDPRLNRLPTSGFWVDSCTRTPLRLVNAYTGCTGDTVVKFNPYSKRYFVAIDLTGNGYTDFC